MEEWHQKLHNNTCPDDVVICQVIDVLNSSYAVEILALKISWLRLPMGRH